jgi:isopenicillin-N epimerase
MVGALYPVPLPWRQYPDPPPPDWADPLQDWLWYEHRLEVPVTFIPGEPSRILRISAQLYNGPEEYTYLAALLEDAPGFD